MGYSIAKVFKPIIKYISQNNETFYIEMPAPSHKPLQIIRNILFVRNAISKYNPDIIHVIGSEHYLLPFINKKKSVITIHDIGFFVNEKNIAKKIWKYFMFIFPIRYAPNKVYISEKTKIECVKYLKEINDNIIPNCIGHEFQFKENVIKAKPIILHIGTSPNKNLSRVIEAIHNLDVHLRIIGTISDEIKILLNNNNISYSNSFKLSDKEILEEYYNCNVVSFPSLYEGFGMPIIEGQSTGRVVVTSNLSPMKEISGDGSILVNPTDTNSIKKGFQYAISIPKVIIDKGYENLLSQKCNVFFFKIALAHIKSHI